MCKCKDILDLCQCKSRPKEPAVIWQALAASGTLAVVNRFEDFQVENDEAPQLIEFEVHPETIA
ncbi:MAG: hypothetical protein Fur0043_01290 [Anaerolineales bacterium]